MGSKCITAWNHTCVKVKRRKTNHPQCLIHKWREGKKVAKTYIPRITSLVFVCASIYIYCESLNWRSSLLLDKTKITFSLWLLCCMHGFFSRTQLYTTLNLSAQVKIYLEFVRLNSLLLLFHQNYRPKNLNEWSIDWFKLVKKLQISRIIMFKVVIDWHKRHDLQHFFNQKKKKNQSFAHGATPYMFISIETFNL